MWYKILGVNENASWEEIENAYLNLMNDPKYSYDETSITLKNAYKEAKMYYEEKNQQTKGIRKIKSHKLYNFSKVILIISFSLIIISFFISYVRKDSYIASITSKKTLNIQECLTSLTNKGVFSNEEAQSILTKNGYEDIFVEDMHVSAKKSIGNKKIQFDLYTIGLYSQCEIEIYEETIFENEYFLRSIGNLGDTLDIFKIEYTYKNISGSYSNFAGYIAINDTKESYKVQSNQIFNDERYNKFLVVKKDLELRDLMVKELENLK